ncbi:MAG: glycosyltransferase family 4 protein [Deltaproteobacteria bacterium]
MRASLGALVLSLVVAAAVTPLVRWAARRGGIVDNPGGRRVNTRVIPRLGGLAVVAGFVAPLAALAFTQSDVAEMFYADPLHMVGLLVGGIIVVSLGAWDDIRGVRAWHKLGVQVLAALVAWACGFRMEHLTLPFIGELDLGVFGLPVTLLWITAIVNAINLIDGLDGLAGGIAFFACLTNFVVAALNGNPLVMLLAAALGGAILGCLLYNFNPATIFMGDSGSMFLGFVLATTSMLGSSIQGSTTVAILVPLISLGVPIMDTLFAMVRRVVERRPIFSPDRGHIHHRLLDLGITHRRAVLILYGVSIVFTAGAITVALGRNWSVGAALLVLTVAMLGLARFVGYFEYLQIRRRQKQHIHSRGTERLRVAVPELIRSLEDVDRDDIPAMLERFASVAELLELELEPAGEEPVRGLRPMRWLASADAYPNGAREPVRASFVVGAARAKLRVAWLSDDGDVSPQADILLQIAADALERRIRGSLPAPAASSAAIEAEVVEHLRDSSPA